MKYLTATICVTLAVLFGSMGVVSTSNAETIWCKTLGIGCKDAEDIKKEQLRCRRLADQQYREKLAEALADPSVWQLGGYDSAQDYAQKRKLGIYRICIKDL
tara:strand:- start:89 stop:394 length:306 start_codon:yes stop_codon:yes gene_type:complete